MPDTAVVWFRRDLRVRDLPALAHACREHERVVPLFVFDPALLARALPLPARTAWMLGCLEALDGELRARGGRLVLRHGRPQTEVRRVAAEVGARTVHVSDDVTGFARARDARVEQALGRDGVRLIRHPGLYVADLAAIRTAAGGPYTVYSPFLRAWKAQERRAVERAPREIAMPRIAAGGLPSLRALGFDGRAPRLDDPPSPARTPRGAPRARWLDGAGPGALRRAPRRAGRADLAPVGLPALRLPVGARARARAWPPGASRATATSSRGATSTPRCRCTSRTTARLELQERYRALEWDADAELLAAWREGRTGFPVVDAAMRQLAATGWMHNRARMIVGSFLTKDLQQDWREGERHFMAHLLDGDVRQQQRRLAVDRLDRHRSGALLPAPLQPDDPAAPLRRRRALRAPLVPRAAPRARRPARRAVDDERRRAGGRGLPHRARLPRADRRPRGGAAAGDRALSGRVGPSCRRDGSAAGYARDGAPSGSAANAASRSASLNSGSSSVPAR